MVGSEAAENANWFSLAHIKEPEFRALNSTVTRICKCGVSFKVAHADTQFCSNKCRMRAVRASAPPRVRSIHTTNASAIAGAAQLYIHDEAVVADVTWGRGQFWRKTNTRRFRLIGSDFVNAKAEAVRADFRQLPYGDEAIDIVVFDPPYVWDGHPRMTNHDRFGGVDTAPGSIDDVLELYAAGMREACRVLKPRGKLFVKTIDQIVNSGPRWFSRELPAVAEQLGMFLRDELIVKANKTPQYPQWKNQFHVWKQHSFLLIFERR